MVAMFASELTDALTDGRVTWPEVGLIATGAAVLVALVVAWVKVMK